MSRIFWARSASGDASCFDVVCLVVVVVVVFFAGKALHSARKRASRACFPSLLRKFSRVGGSGGFGTGSPFKGGKSGGGCTPERVFSKVWRRDGGIRKMC